MHPSKLSLSMFYNASRLRTDGWDELKSHGRRLHDAVRRGGDVEAARAKVLDCLGRLQPLEAYFAFPGARSVDELTKRARPGHEGEFARAATHLARMLSSDGWRSLSGRGRRASDIEMLATLEDAERIEGEEARKSARPYFEVLVVGTLSEYEERDLREQLLAQRDDDDEFIYDIVTVPSFEDALIAVLLNVNVQAVLMRYGFPLESSNRFDIMRAGLVEFADGLDAADEPRMALSLAQSIRRLRPTLDLFLITDAPVEEVAGILGRYFRRVFYRTEDYLELHLSILKGIRERYETPFFNALKKYSQRPTGVFHALPISRGKSITKSHWIRDMGEFYGHKVFLAETSATTGGLDSLLQPHGPIKRAQEAAARAFGAERTYFVTNGTSTANKIVLQALVQPQDIVLVSRDCHKSHHYTMMLTGAQPLYMDSYPLQQYSMYGAVPLREIKTHLRALERAGELDRVKVLLLTNCTFDGIVYNPRRVMREVLAIKPDIIFVWDEAWYAFAGFSPMTRRRTAMASAAELRATFKTQEYREEYERWKLEHDALDPDADETWVDRPLLPDPDNVRVRAYATQSTHKTLTSLRQGSMIHVFDQDFEREIEFAFDDAYMTHTSTSPNYQIIASLDVGRRQVEMEGYELVQHSTELALTLRERIAKHPQLSKYFRVLGPAELVPQAHRASGFTSYREVGTDWQAMDASWEYDEFCLDPTRVTIAVGLTGLDGDSFKCELMERFDIQINKTSRNTVLFMTHIGTTRGSVAYLVDVFDEIARAFERDHEDESEIASRLHDDAVRSLTEDLPPLPNFSRFASAYEAVPGSTSSVGEVRRAYFDAQDETRIEYLRLGGPIRAAMDSGREVVAASFVTPYPPGFPILVPGQVISDEILAFLRAVDVKEIHGYKPQYGLRVFTEDALAAAGAS